MHFNPRPRFSKAFSRGGERQTPPRLYIDSEFPVFIGLIYQSVKIRYKKNVYWVKSKLDFLTVWLSTKQLQRGEKGVLIFNKNWGFTCFYNLKRHNFQSHSWNGHCRLRSIWIRSGLTRSDRKVQQVLTWPNRFSLNFVGPAGFVQYPANNKSNCATPLA